MKVLIIIKAKYTKGINIDTRLAVKKNFRYIKAPIDTIAQNIDK